MVLDVVNFTVHIFAGAALLGLVFLLLRAQKQLQFVRICTRSYSSSLPQVAVPNVFLARFASAFGIAASNLEACRRETPCVIDGRSLLEVHLQYCILEIVQKTSSTKETIFVLQLRVQPEDREAVLVKLRSSFHRTFVLDGT